MGRRWRRKGCPGYRVLSAVVVSSPKGVALLIKVLQFSFFFYSEFIMELFEHTKRSDHVLGFRIHGFTWVGSIPGYAVAWED